MVETARCCEGQQKALIPDALKNPLKPKAGILWRGFGVG